MTPLSPEIICSFGQKYKILLEEIRAYLYEALCLRVGRALIQWHRVITIVWPKARVVGRQVLVKLMQCGVCV